MTADEANCAATNAIGSARYLAASSQPTGGAPSTKGNSHAVPVPA